MRAKRVLVTVLFADIAGSSAKATELGDRRWSELLGRYRSAVRCELRRARGREVDEAGDGVLACFETPAAAIRCACAIQRATAALGLEVRVGLHTGECEQVRGRIIGIAVHTGARVAAHADPGEVLVSSTVKELVAGSGLEFRDRGLHRLDGVGEWHLYAAAA
jgi:class 3 adenylate cyclase